MYNWNGDYEVIKPIENHKRMQVVGDNYPEIFWIYEEKGLLEYCIMDDNFGMPSLANNSNTPYAKKLRQRSIKILDELEQQGYIKKIKK